MSYLPAMAFPARSLPRSETGAQRNKALVHLVIPRHAEVATTCFVQTPG
jgi:hypothetical protein